MLENENSILKNKVEELEKISKKNNLLLFGFDVAPDTDKSELILSTVKKLNSLLDINICESDISDIFVFGNANKPIIKLALVSYLRKSLILSKVKNLQVSIDRDRTKKEQTERKTLYKYLKSAWGDGFKNYIKNKLFLGDKEVTLEEARNGYTVNSQQSSHGLDDNIKLKRKKDSPLISKRTARKYTTRSKGGQ